MFLKDTFKKYFDEKLIFIIFTILAMVYLSLKLLINGGGLIFLFLFWPPLFLENLVFRMKFILRIRKNLIKIISYHIF